MRRSSATRRGVRGSRVGTCCDSGIGFCPSARIRALTTGRFYGGAIPAGSLHLFEGRAHITGHDAASHFDRHDGSDALKKSDHYNAQDLQECVFFLRSLPHAGGDRTDESVAEQNAEEGADERGGYFFPDLFRRAAEGSHGDDDSKFRLDDAESG